MKWAGRKTQVLSRLEVAIPSEFDRESSIASSDRESNGAEYNIIDSIPVEQFTETLWPIIESNSYSDDKIWIDSGYPDMLRIIIYNTIGLGIMYQCLPSENCELIKEKLQRICKAIISDINNDLIQDAKRKSNLKVLAGDLLSCLDKLRYSNHLRFGDLDALRCNYINY